MKTSEVANSVLFAYLLPITTHHNKRIYRTPRVFSLIFLAFLVLLSLDVYAPELSWGEIALGFLMHNIPAIILGILIYFAWKKEIVGAISFALGGLLYMGFVARSAYQDGFERYLLARTIQFSGLMFVVARLFWKGRVASKGQK